jgi:hypothetical protein
MPTINNNNNNTEEELDFFGGKHTESTPTNDFKKTHIETPKFQFAKFKKLGLGAIAAVVVASASIGSYEAYETHQKNKVAEVEQSVKQANPDSILNTLEKEKNTINKLHLTNALLFNKYGESKEIVELLNLQQSVAQKIKKNDNLYKSSLESLQSDVNDIQKVIGATKPGVSFDAKKEVLLNDSQISKFNQWKTLVGSNQYMYAGELLKLEKETKENLEFLEQTKKEIVETVNQKIQTKDFNLNATASALSEKVTKDLGSEIGELEKVKQELKGTDQENLLTDKDLSEAKEAVTDLQSQAVSQIAQDRAKVEAMIASASANQVAPTPAATVQNTQVPTNTTTVIHHHDNHMSFADYYLMYHWLAGGNSSSPAVVASSSYHNNSYSNPIQSSLHQHAASRYDIRNNDSYLNRSLSTNFGNSGRGLDNTANTQNNRTGTFNRNFSNNPNVKPLDASKFGNNPNAKPLNTNALDKFRSITAPKYNVDDLRQKIKAAHEKAATAQNTHKVEVQKKMEFARKAEETRKADIARKAEAMRSKSSSSSSSISGFSKKSSSSSSSSSFSSRSSSRSSSRRR